MSKSYVTLAVCPICKEDTGTLLLDRRLRETFEMHTVTPDPCDKCKEKYLTNGIMLICPTSGDLAVLKIEAFERIFNKPIPPKHIAFVEDGLLQQIGAI